MAKRRRGRPELINQDRIDQALAVLRAGAYIESAAAAAGVCRDAFRKWMRRGEAEQQRVAEGKGRKVRASERLYVDLVVGIQKALGEAELRYLSTIQAAGQGLTLKRTVVKTKTTGTGTDDDPLVTMTETTTEDRVVRSWQAHAWILERRFPHKWGARQQDDAGAEEEPLVITFPDQGLEGEPDETFDDMLPPEDR